MTVGEIAYAGFKLSIDAEKDHTTAPGWESLPDKIRRAWEQAAEGLLKLYKIPAAQPTGWKESMKNVARSND